MVIAYIKWQENNTMGAGKFKRFSTGGGLCLVRCMSNYMRMAKLTVHQDSTEWKGESVRRTPCELCCRLFPLVPGGERGAQPGVAKLSKSTISTVDTKLLLQAGIDEYKYFFRIQKKISVEDWVFSVQF